MVRSQNPAAVLSNVFVDMLFKCDVLQPKLTDEEGWKKFCLGERIYLGASACSTDAEPEAELDYSKVLNPVRSFDTSSLKYDCTTR